MGGPPGEHVRFVTAISRRIEAELYPPQELIVRAGEVSGKMFIISKGTQINVEDVALKMSERLGLVAQRGRILHQGQIFGQHMLLNKIDSLTIYDARTLTYVDAYSFSRCGSQCYSKWLADSEMRSRSGRNLAQPSLPQQVQNDSKSHRAVSIESTLARTSSLILTLTSVSSRSTSSCLRFARFRN